MATVNLGRIKPIWKGAWNSSTQYIADDIVSYNNATWIAITTSTNSAPANGNSNWDKMNEGYSLDDGSVTSAKLASSLDLSSKTVTLPSGVGGKISAIQRFYLNGNTAVSNQSAEYNFWSVTYNRQYSNSNIWVISDIPTAELPNGVWVGSFLTVNGFKSSRGLKTARPNTDTTLFGFNSWITSTEVGSTTGNITISHGWNWGGANEAVRPMSYINFKGSRGTGVVNASVDSRILPEYETQGQMVVMEIL